MNITIPTINWIVALPVLTLTLTAVAVMVSDFLLPKGSRQFLVALSFLGLLATAATFLLWPPETTFTFSNMLVADGVGLILGLVLLVTAALSLLFSPGYLAQQQLDRGEYYVLLLLATTGGLIIVTGADLIILFLGIEVLSLALYILAGLARERAASQEAALKYFLAGAFASAFLLYGIALTYGALGTTNLLTIADRLGPSAIRPEPLLLAGLGLIVVGFGFKVAAVPFHLWTPDVYEGAPTPITAFMSGAAKAAGFAAIVRVFVLALPAVQATWAPLWAVLAILTMVVGNTAALWQRDMKRLLAYSSIAHAGYLLIGVVAGGSRGGAAVLFYLAAYVLMNLGAFGVVLALGETGQEHTGINDLAGLSQRAPLLAAALSVFLLSLAGIPTTAGFVGKLYLFTAAIEAGWIGLAVVGVLASVVSVFYYLNVIVVMYMRPATATLPSPRPDRALVTMLILAVVGTFALGLIPSPLIDLSYRTLLTLVLR